MRYTISGNIIITKDDSGAEITREAYTTDGELVARKNQIKTAIAWIKANFKIGGNLITQAQLETFLTDAQTQILLYEHGSNTIVTWLNNTFPNKAYFSATAQTALLQILTLT